MEVMYTDAHRVGLAVFAVGIMDVALIVWMPMAWKYLASSPPSDLLSFPLLAASPNPLATWLQSVFVGVILTVKGALIYAKRTRVTTGLVSSALAVLFTLSSMLTFTYRNYPLSLILFLLAILSFAV
jgi:hypothetical protein